MLKRTIFVSAHVLEKNVTGAYVYLQSVLKCQTTLLLLYYIGLNTFPSLSCKWHSGTE